MTSARTIWLLVALAMIALSCSDDTDGLQFVLTPEEPVPGTEFEVAGDEDLDLGIGYVLEVKDGGNWSAAYRLEPAGDGKEAVAEPVLGGVVVVEPALRIDSDGSDVLMMPADLAPEQEVKLCTDDRTYCQGVTLGG